MQDGYTPTVLVPGFDIGTFIMGIFGQIVGFLPVLWQWFLELLAILVVVSIPLCIVLLIAIVYCVEQLKKIKKLEAIKYDSNIEPAFEEVKGKGNKDMAIRWQKVQSHLNSPNQNDWKQAVLEADTMLLDVLTGLGYQGDGVGEKLKRVQPGDFRNLDNAWEAHKLRNTIAHGAGYQLDHHTAVQAIHKFRSVFEEFYYI